MPIEQAYIEDNSYFNKIVRDIFGSKRQTDQFNGFYEKDEVELITPTSSHNRVVIVQPTDNWSDGVVHDFDESDDIMEWPPDFDENSDQL
ncbi:MAG: hypothetical protein AB1489_07620 [Acidobacteriota bacterium]